MTITEQLVKALRPFAERAKTLPPTAADSAVVHFRYRDCRKARAVLAAYEASKAEVRRKHDLRTGPCPTCGFRITKVERPPFVIEDEEISPARVTESEVR